MIRLKGSKEYMKAYTKCYVKKNLNRFIKSTVCGLLSVGLIITAIPTGALAGIGVNLLQVNTAIAAESNMTYTVGGSTYEYSIMSDNTISIKGWSGTDTEIQIPSVINGIQVTTLAWQCFKGCESLTSIKVSSGVKVISMNAFEGCTNLKSISLPQGLEIIDSGAFDGCAALEELVIPEGVKVLNEVFGYNDSLKRLVIPSTVTEINMVNINSASIVLEEVVVSSNNPVYASQDGVLYTKDMTELICYPRGKKVTVYNVASSVTKIRSYAFGGDSNLTDIIIPKSVTDIGERAFFNTSELININVDAENSYYTSVNGVLESKDRTALIWYPDNNTSEKYVIPSGVTRIEDNMFDGNKYIKEVLLHDGVTYIGMSAFYGCENLESINIPESVTYIAPYAFYNCKKIKEFTIPAGVTNIYTCTFMYCTGLENLVISGDVTSIAHNAFAYCLSLNEIVLPKSLETLYIDAFHNCSSLNMIIIPKNVKELIHKSGQQTSLATYGIAMYYYDSCEALDDIMECKEYYKDLKFWRILEPDVLIYGDVNADAEVDIVDGVILKQHLAGISQDICFDACDINADGDINVSDAVKLMKYLAGYNELLGSE